MKNYPKKLPIFLIIIFVLGIGLCFSEPIIEAFKGNSSKEDAEKDLACFLEYSEGVGKAAVKICYNDDGSVAGVAVVCTGAQSAVVRASVTQLVSKSLGIPTSRVYVSSSSDAFEKVLKEGSG